MKNLDFIILGAQKCATTTLFELLRQHPDINMPLEKEVPFFSGADYDPAGWQDFAQRYFAGDKGRLWGKVTPQYMADAQVPARIAAQMPRAKLIAVLRDPIERSRSHYRMALRRHTEARPFARAMEELLDPGALARARAGSAPEHAQGYESEADYYLAWSEYGQILARYRGHFPAAQMLVIYTEDLHDRPAEVLGRVLAFLELDPAFTPRGLGEVMHAGGSSSRIPHGVRVWLRERSLVSRIWQRVPAQTQGRLRFLYERWNSKKDKVELPLPEALREQLSAHFGEDIDLLTHSGFDTPPWAGDYQETRAGTHSRGDADPLPAAV